MNNWYSSPNLFQKLQSIKINAIKTVRFKGKDIKELKWSEVISNLLIISCKIERQKKIFIYYLQNIRKLKWWK